MFFLSCFLVTLSLFSFIIFSLLLKILVIFILKSLMVNSSVLMTCRTVSIPYYFSYGFCLFDNGAHFVMKILCFLKIIFQRQFTLFLFDQHLGLITSISQIRVTQGKPLDESERA